MLPVSPESSLITRSYDINFQRPRPPVGYPSSDRKNPESPAFQPHIVVQSDMNKHLYEDSHCGS